MAVLGKILQPGITLVRDAVCMPAIAFPERFLQPVNRIKCNITAEFPGLHIAAGKMAARNPAPVGPVSEFTFHMNNPLE
ncbi:hypothetical protein D3C80_1611290 [compost metagenome]